VTVVREATEADIPAITTLYRQLAIDPTETVPTRSPEACRRVFAEMAAMPGYSLLVAEDGGEIAGTLVLAILPGLAHGVSPFAVVEYVVVDEARRGQGIGKMLMEAVMSRAKAAGCYKIMLTSDKQRAGAHEFYKALGFGASAHGFRYYF
jgi:GNAT superfamily N-acetyltransferase